MSFYFGVVGGVIYIHVLFFVEPPINTSLAFIIAWIALSIVEKSVTLLALQTSLLIFLYELTVIGISTTYHQKIGVE